MPVLSWKTRLNFVSIIFLVLFINLVVMSIFNKHKIMYLPSGSALTAGVSQPSGSAPPPVEELYADCCYFRKIDLYARGRYFSINFVNSSSENGFLNISLIPLLFICSKTIGSDEAVKMTMFFWKKSNEHEFYPSSQWQSQHGPIEEYFL